MGSKTFHQSRAVFSLGGICPFWGRASLFGCGLTNVIYRGTKVSFVIYENELLMKYNISLALLATVRTFAEGWTLISRLCPGHWFVRIFSSICFPPLRVGLDKVREGLLLIDDGFYLHVTEDPIYNTNYVLVEWWPQLALLFCEAISFT